MKVFAKLYKSINGTLHGDRSTIQLDSRMSLFHMHQTVTQEAINRGFTHYQLLQENSNPISCIIPIGACHGNSDLSPPPHTTPSNRQPSKQVYNESNGETETATRQTCPRCHGHGSTTSDSAEDCHLCNGWGRVWRTPTGWTLALFARTGQLW